MKRCALCLLAVLLPTVGRAQEGLRIKEVGLQGYYIPDAPTPVRIHLPALPDSQLIRLEFAVDSGSSDRRIGVLRTDRFWKQIQVRASEPIEIEVPLLLPRYERQTLHVIETDSAGRRIDERDLDLGSLESVTGGDSLIAIYCKEDRQCLDARAQISPIRSSEENANKTGPKFAMFKEPRQNWWAYGAAQCVVLADSISDLTEEEEKALEYYLRDGGTLILLEKDVANTRFLAAYRQGDPKAEAVLVGRGRLYRLTSLEAKDLGKVPFNNVSAPLLVQRFVGFMGQQPGAQTFLSRIGVSFSFPRLPWLLLWLAFYILIIGVVNFAILRWLDRLEWGWITVCFVALLFAAGLYVTSSSRRPKNFTLDSVKVYWMDEHSGMALGDFGLRVSSPKRTQVTVSFNDDVVLASHAFSAQSGVEIGAEMTDTHRIEPGWQVQLGPPLEMRILMLRWSFSDFYMEGFHEFPGTVHWTSATRIKNETGQKFRQAIYLDFKANKRYTIPALAPGEETDLAAIIPMEIWRKEKEKPKNEELEDALMARQPKREPFSVEELPYSGFQFGPGDRVFVGLSDIPATSASLDVTVAPRQSLALIVVSMDQP